MDVIIVDCEKYIELMNDNNLKFRSFNDYVYFTLRDIFFNCDDDRNCYIVNDFNKILTNNTSYEDENFNYTNVLYNDITFIKNLYEYLQKFSLKRDKSNVLNNVKIDDKEYMKVDEWWAQMDNLLDRIKSQFEIME